MGASTDALVRLEVLLDRLAREGVAREARARRRVRHGNWKLFSEQVWPAGFFRCKIKAKTTAREEFETSCLSMCAGCGF